MKQKLFSLFMVVMILTACTQSISTAPTPDAVVWISGEAPVTLTVSASWATFIGKSTACVCATFTSIAFFDTVVKPWSSAVTS